MASRAGSKRLSSQQLVMYRGLGVRPCNLNFAEIQSCEASSQETSCTERPEGKQLLWLQNGDCHFSTNLTLRA